MVKDDYDPCILLLDPSIRNFGYAVYGIKSNTVKTLGTISTKGGERDGLRIADVDVDSIVKIVQALREVCFDPYDIRAMVVEHSTGGALDHRSARTLALSESIAVTLGAFFKIPLLLPSQSEVKHCLLGKRSADKMEIEKVVLKHFPGIKLPKAKSKRSHPVDALALLLVAKDWKRYWELKDEIF